MSFTNAPVSRAMVLGVIASSIAVSLLDGKHYFYILVDMHIIRYRQPWRALIYQLCYTNSSEVLFAAMSLYNMRAVERMWGSRKYATFLLTSALLTAFLPPVILTLVLRPLTFGVFNYLPAGPTPLVFAILAQYHALVPHTYKYRLALWPNSREANSPASLVFSDKTYRYIVALQLALFQWPGSVLAAAVGWLVGLSWRSDVLPGALTRWRVPGWIVGMQNQRMASEFESLRERLESEGSAMRSASGIERSDDGIVNRRRAS